MPVSAQCSHCQARLNLADHLAGKRVKCPKCGQIFVAAEEVAALKSAPMASKKEGIAKGPPPVSASKRTAPVKEEPQPRSKKRRDEDSEDDARPARSKRKRQKSSSNHLLLALASGGGVLLVGVVILFIVMSVRSRPAVAETPVVAKAKPASTARAANTNIAEPPADPAPPANVPNAAPSSQPTPQQTTPTQVPAVAATPAKGLQQGAKIIVRTQITGVPAAYPGDYNKEVKQTVELALANLGYQAAPEGSGGLILQVTAQIANTGREVQVKPIGGAPVARPRGKGFQPIQPQQAQRYPEEQVNANLVLTDAQGTALWKTESKFLSHSRIFRTANPLLEMQLEMWTAFNTWVKGPAIQNMR